MIRIRIAALLLAAAGATSACSDYGYGGLSVGYGTGGGYYDDGFYGGGYYDSGYYGAAYGAPYWGWYNGFYYPGTGFYVYDRYRRAYRWNDYQRRYWGDRRNNWRGRDGYRDNWGEFRQDRRGYRGDPRWRGGARDPNGVGGAPGRSQVYRGAPRAPSATAPQRAPGTRYSQPQRSGQARERGTSRPQ